MGDINLTSSMRLSLLSLQGIAEQRSTAQINLSTGQKINSAIDNPDVYYTAANLNDRVNDLSQLLDNMTQGIQALKAADGALSYGLRYLEQAKAVALSALDNILKSNTQSPNPPPIEPDFPEVPEEEPPPDFTDYTHVSTIDELSAALADSSKDKIVITQSLTLSNNQKLVIGSGKTLAALTSDITINFSSDSTENNTAMLTMSNNSRLENITVNFDKSSTSGTASAIAAENADFSLSGVIINTTGRAARGIYAAKNSVITGSASISTSGNNGSDGLALHQSSFSGDININTYGVGVYAVNANAGSSVSGKIQAATSGMLAAGVVIQNKSTLSGSINIITFGEKAEALKIETNSTILKDTVLHAFSQQAPTIYLAGKIEKEAQFYLADNGSETMTGFTAPSQITSTASLLETGKNKSSAEFIDWMKKELNHTSFVDKSRLISNFTLAARQADEQTETITTSEETAKQFNNILEQYNQLVNDAGYKGVNLLRSQNLRINFNEDRSSSVYIKGIDASADALKVNIAEWKTADEIAQSIKEIENAVNQIRHDSSFFNNNYFIVEKREDFTNQLINILTEGTDKLTLADMNEESADMLSLQTREMLAVNALSLASQSSRSIMYLF